MTKICSNTLLDEYLAKVQSAPRVQNMMQEFSAIANGHKGLPTRKVILDTSLVKHIPEALHFSNIREQYAGYFNQHFVASLPYILEEQCRIGVGLNAYAKHISKLDYGKPFHLYTLGDGPGVMARALVDFSCGGICTLTCSPNPENKTAFIQKLPSFPAYFHLGPFYEVNPALLNSQFNNTFSEGFDLIFEDTTFQMYAKERMEPIMLAMRNLKPNGVFVFLEKFSCADNEEFNRREKQKDDEFKSLYFTKQSIAEKNRTIVNQMNDFLVSIDEFSKVIHSLFRYAVILWNSCNFYTIAASDDRLKLELLIEKLSTPAIPNVFCYSKYPTWL